MSQNGNDKPKHNHAGHRDRLRKKFIENPSSLEEHELLELLLFYAIPQKNTNDIAKELILTFGSLQEVLSANPLDLTAFKHIKENAAVLMSLTNYIAVSNEQNKAKKISKNVDILTKSETAREYAKSLFLDADYERFYLICLNSRKRVLRAVLVNEGTLDEVPVYSREVVELVLRHKAHSVILSHNHPGGSLTPSQADLSLTNNIVRALEPIGVVVNDHIIVAGERSLSFREEGYL
ncbi:MAG TPA: DNA repair protein RadC [Clostridiales bacterium]|jgi:DNA repair protein RadC|nr:DNA repair protein RadC [Clostridiales bacterium]